jgi:hypothetical protein
METIASQARARVQFYKSKFTSPSLQVQVYKSKFTSPSLQVQVYKSKFTSPSLQVQVYKSKFTSPILLGPILQALLAPPQSKCLLLLLITTYIRSNHSIEL